MAKNRLHAHPLCLATRHGHKKVCVCAGVLECGGACLRPCIWVCEYVHVRVCACVLACSCMLLPPPPARYVPVHLCIGKREQR
jgi:hypothetical protein